MGVAIWSLTGAPIREVYVNIQSKDYFCKECMHLKTSFLIEVQHTYNIECRYVEVLLGYILSAVMLRFYWLILWCYVEVLLGYIMVLC